MTDGISDTNTTNICLDIKSDMISPFFLQQSIENEGAASFNSKFERKINSRATSMNINYSGFRRKYVLASGI